MGAGPSDYLDGVFAEQVKAEAAAALLAAAEPWGAIDLPQLPAGSPLLTAPVPAGWSDERTPAEPCPAAALPATPSPRLLENLRHDRRHAARDGISLIAAADEAATLALLEALFTLHTARWRGRGQPGAFADPAVRRFHRQAAPALARAGLLRLYALRREADGAILAVLYGMAAKRRFYYYLGGFDPDLASLGLGTLLIGCAMEAAMDEGAAVFDFLRGRESYKYRWGAADQQTFSRRLRTPSGPH
jgi:CelD/BcsL family acetyltransferase involved in cellulose biosynthesis